MKRTATEPDLTYFKRKEYLGDRVHPRTNLPKGLGLRPSETAKRGKGKKKQEKAISTVQTFANRLTLSSVSNECVV